MDFKVNREIFSTNEVVYEGSNEQSVELDYILPDYFPDIFRVLKCQLSPKVVSYNVNGDKLSYELVAYIKVLYTSENSNALYTMEQKMNYTKTVDIGKNADNPDVILNCKADYMNCRVVNAKRLDLRGAVSTKCKVTCQKKQEIVIDAYGSDIELKKDTVSYPSKHLCASKTVTLFEDLDMGMSKPDIDNVVRAEAQVYDSELKIIPGKIIVKGSAVVYLLYTCVKDGDNELESMQFELPFSQIVDIEGISEDYFVNAECNALSCEIIPKVSGEDSKAECEIVMTICCTAIKYENAQIVTDAYSTKYPCSCTCSNSKIDMEPVKVCEMHALKDSLEYNDGDITCVYDAYAKVTQINSRYDNDKHCYIFYGNCCCTVIARNEDGCPIYLENDIPFEHTYEAEGLDENCTIDPKAMVVSCSYNMTSTNSVEIKADIKIWGCLYQSVSTSMMSDIEVDTSVEKERDNNYALKLYFAECNEKVWDIAKKYNSSVEAIMKENELTKDCIQSKEMLLIPYIM